MEFITNDLVTLDFETAYDTANRYSLKHMTTLEYVADERFTILGVGIKYNDTPTEWHTTNLDSVLRDAITPDTTLCAHNTRFDGLILDYHFNRLPGRYLDTLSMARTLLANNTGSLEKLAEALFPNDPSKRKGKELAEIDGVFTLDENQNRRIGGYCRNDVNLTYDCLNTMLAFFPDQELRIIDILMRMYLEPALKIDVPLLEDFVKRDKARVDAALERAGIERIRLSSNDRFAALLRDLGLKPPTKISKTTGKKTWAFSKKDLDFIDLKGQHPEHDAIWEARAAVKSTLDRGRAIRLIYNATVDDNKFRVPLNQFGAHTGRFSGTDKINPQNFSRDSGIRQALIAPDDCWVYVGDLAQIEARMAAWLAGEKELIDAFARGEDIYSMFASVLYNRPIDRKRKLQDSDGNYLDKDGNIVDSDNAYMPDFLEGFIGKMCILGLGYGMGADTFRTQLAVGSMGPPVYFSHAEAHKYVNTYRATYPRIRAAWRRCDNILLHMLSSSTDYTWGPLRIMKRRIVLPNGTSLMYPKLTYFEHSQSFAYWNGNFWKDIYGSLLFENIIQALSACVIKDSMDNIHQKMKGDQKIALQVHDEIVGVGSKDNADEKLEAMLDIMATPPSWCSDLPLKAEGGYAAYYSK